LPVPVGAEKGPMNAAFFPVAFIGMVAVDGEAAEGVGLYSSNGDVEGEFLAVAEDGEVGAADF